MTKASDTQLAHLETASLVVESTAASSLIRCGRFPVFSSCSITPTTITSLIPSVSILGSFSGPGEGGGVCWYVVRPLLLGRSANETVLVDDIDDAVEDLGRDNRVGDDADVVCDLLTFFVGGGQDSVGFEGAESLEVEGR